MMKKAISLILCLAMLITGAALVSCGDKGSASGGGKDGASETNASPVDIMAAIVAKYPDIPNQKALYVNGAGEDDEGYLDPEYAGYLYTGNYEVCPEMAMLESYAIRLPDGKSAFEIHIMKVADEANVEAVKALLQSRIGVIESGDIKLYDPEGYDKVMKNAEVYVSGKYVYLLITTDNAPAKEAIASF